MEPKIQSEKTEVRVALETLGCKLNQSETEMLSRQLEQAGCKVVSAVEKADIYILNTCTVTHVADRKSRHFLRMARRRNPDAMIIAIGCYAERSFQDLSEIEGVDIVAGNKDKMNLAQVLKDAGYFKSIEAKSNSVRGNRTRSFIKAQDGCNNFCSYCIVPVVRGREKSLPPDQVINEINQRVADGYQEIVLTGTEIGRYFSGGLDLKWLLERILSDTGILRLRLSSVQPQEISPELIRLWKNPRLCRHFHISLQSGSDAVLRRMNRRYSTVDYSKAVELIRSEIPDVAVTTDIIVGFPGESEDEFQESFDFCREMKFARIHVFPYSIREGNEGGSNAGTDKLSGEKGEDRKNAGPGKNQPAGFLHSFFGTDPDCSF